MRLIFISAFPRRASSPQRAFPPVVQNWPFNLTVPPSAAALNLALVARRLCVLYSLMNPPRRLLLERVFGAQRTVDPVFLNTPQFLSEPLGEVPRIAMLTK